VHCEVTADRGGDATQIIWIAGHDQISPVKRADHNSPINQIASTARGKDLPG
jgi:hypothetical protein